jgi:hypothetical protein
LKILAHAIAQGFGLADVDDLAFGIFVNVHAWLHRQILYFLVERHASKSTIQIPMRQPDLPDSSWCGAMAFQRF